MLDDIEGLLREEGVDIWGVAANEPPFALAPDLPRAISLAMRLRPESLAGVETAPTALYYEEYQRVNAALDEAASALAVALQAAGRRAEAATATVYHDVEDWTAAGVFAHKTAATRAGLGWIGKTALFVSPEFGPRVRLATVFTDLDLTPGTPITESRCGACRVCVDTCHADAGRDVQWHAGMPRDELLDAKACELQLERFGDHGICGACLAVCPVGR